MRSFDIKTDKYKYDLEFTTGGMAIKSPHAEMDKILVDVGNFLKENYGVCCKYLEGFLTPEMMECYNKRDDWLRMRELTVAKFGWRYKYEVAYEAKSPFIRVTIDFLPWTGTIYNP